MACDQVLYICDLYLFRESGKEVNGIIAKIEIPHIMTMTCN